MVIAGPDVTVHFKPAPKFESNLVTGVCTMTIYSGHYDRLMAVVVAARTGNQTLIKLALVLLDEKGSSQ